MEIFGTHGCYNRLILPQNFSIGTSPQNLSAIIINLASDTANISGVALFCTGNPVTNGSVVVIDHGWFNQYPVSTEGSFNISRFLSGGPSDVFLIAVNNTDNEQTTPHNIFLTLAKIPLVPSWPAGFPIPSL